MPLDAPTFVIQRRVNEPMTVIQRGLADRAPLVAQRVVELAGDGFMHFDEPLRPVAPFSARQPMPTWCARGRLLNARGRVVAAVELEVSMWARDATSVSLRPVARHPERWRAWRMRHYFRLAHGGADATARLLAQRAATSTATRIDEDVAASRRGALAVGASY